MQTSTSSISTLPVPGGSAARDAEYNQRSVGDPGALIPNQTEIALASLIQSALADSAPGDAEAESMKKISRALTKNTLRKWLYGAAVVAGDADDFKDVFGLTAATAGAALNSDLIKSIRRQTGNDWNASVQMAKKISDKADEALENQQWANLISGRNRPAGIGGVPQTRGVGGFPAPG